MKPPILPICTETQTSLSLLVFERQRQKAFPQLTIDDGVGANAIHGVQFQIPLEVSGVEPGNRQTVAKSSLLGGGREGEGVGEGGEGGRM
ncbi:hypothetical protein F7725_028521 [Dissostichus mawsoni]|uniref:Uncharacterized protein n=1 Tax=Dissostichus mawsoni TaxID=36200 RepID=A0A7J5XGK1_DISMA|nr:hypothetical protein F7725_028521 [Dissostichus mawsoni]